MAYALRYGEQEIPFGSVRRRMALHRPASSRAHRTRTPQAARLAGDPRRRLLHSKVKSGCPWRLLAKDFPPWKTVYDWFRRWRIDGTWERLNTELRERLRVRLGRNPQPSAAILWTPSQPGPQEWEAQSAASTPPRSWKVEKAPLAGGHRGTGARGAGPQRQGSRRRRHQAAVPGPPARAIASLGDFLTTYFGKRILVMVSKRTAAGGGADGSNRLALTMMVASFSGRYHI